VVRRAGVQQCRRALARLQGAPVIVIGLARRLTARPGEQQWRQRDTEDRREIRRTDTAGRMHRAQPPAGVQSEGQGRTENTRHCSNHEYQRSQPSAFSPSRSHARPPGGQSADERCDKRHQMHPDVLGLNPAVEQRCGHTGQCRAHDDLANSRRRSDLHRCATGLTPGRAVRLSVHPTPSAPADRAMVDRRTRRMKRAPLVARSRDTVGRRAHGGKPRTGMSVPRLAFHARQIFENSG
jgi:hypothetical protein